MPTPDPSSRNSHGFVAGVILAGGASTRMGRDKTAIKPHGLDGLTLLEWAVRRMGAAMSRWVVADGGRGLVPGAESVADGDGAGPIAGLLGAAARLPGRRLLALACDLPLVPASVLCRLIEHDEDQVVPESSHGPEPLCAVYGPQALKALAERAASRRFSLRDVGAGNPTMTQKRILRRDLAAELPSGFDWEDLFLNANRPEDLQRAELLLKRHDISQFLRVGSTRR